MQPVGSPGLWVCLALAVCGRVRDRRGVSVSEQPVVSRGAAFWSQLGAVGGSLLAERPWVGWGLAPVGWGGERGGSACERSERAHW